MPNVVLRGRNHLNFAPMQVLYNLINEKVQDINATRRSKPTPSQRQYVFPTFPEANDENYPRIALVNENVRFSEYGSGRFLKYIKSGGKVEHIVFAKVATLPLTISIFVKKKQKHAVTLYDGSTIIVQNSKQADYLGDMIEKCIEMYREEYFIPNNMDIRILGVSRTYDDGDFLLVKNIDCEIEMFDEWELDLTSPESTVGNIDNINLDINVEQVGG